MEEFQQAISYCDLHELDLEEVCFHMKRGHRVKTLAQEKLDRGRTVLTTFGTLSKIKYLGVKLPQLRQFRLESTWLKEDDHKPISFMIGSVY